MHLQIISHFPAIAEVRSVAERMKSLDPDQLTIAANRNGQVKLIMNHSTLKVDTTWSGLQAGDDEEMAEEQAESSKRFKSVQVDLKAFVKLVSCNLPEHEIELWIFARACATFVVGAAGEKASGGQRTHPGLVADPHKEHCRPQGVCGPHHGQSPGPACTLRELRSHLLSRSTCPA